MKGSRRNKASVNCKVNILHEAKEHTSQLNKGMKLMTPIAAYLTSSAPSADDPLLLSSLSTLTGRTNVLIRAAVMAIANGASSSNPARHLPCSL
jgi:hypothetical protein